jgi:hypothetical protein
VEKENDFMYYNYIKYTKNYSFNRRIYMKISYMVNKFKITYIFFASLSIWIILWTQGYGIFGFPGVAKTPEKAIYTRFKDESDIWRLKKVIADIDIDDNRKLIFYENENNAVMVSYLHKIWNGMWKVTDTSGEVAMECRTKNISALHSNYNELWIYGGIIYNDAVYKIKNNDTEARIVNADNLRLWYLIDNKQFDGCYDIELYNSYGDVVAIIK